jgi:hypothetical protein
MNFFSLNIGFPTSRDFEALNNEKIKNKIQLLFEFEKMLNSISIPWVDYFHHTNLSDLYENLLEEISVNFLDLKSSYDTLPANWKKGSVNEKFSRNVFWAHSINEIKDFKQKANPKDLQSEIKLYEEIFKSLNLSIKDYEYTKDGLKTKLLSIRDNFDSETIKDIHTELHEKIQKQTLWLNRRIEFSQSFKSDIKENNIFEYLKDYYINDCLDEGYDEEIIMAYANDHNFVKNEIVEIAFAYAPFGSTGSPSDKGYNWDTLVNDIVKYRTQINEKETIEFLSNIKRELKEINSIIDVLIK